MILVGDIGGSNSRLALAERSGNRVEFTRVVRQSNVGVASLAELIRPLLSGHDVPKHSCLAVAGPTDGRHVQLTNLDWRIDADLLGHEFGFPFRLINDFEAVAWGLDALAENDLTLLQTGQCNPRAPRLAMGPGTGLGVALGIPGQNGYRPQPGEGGHIGFAPVDDEQISLLRFLQSRYGRVSVERILSGPGIADLYLFCRSASGRATTRERSPAEVTQAALDGDDPMAIWAVRLFCRILGQTAGDLALAAGARGGVYLAGGIPPRLLPLLTGNDFLEGFRNKGRFSEWMTTLPVQVVTDPDIGLKGAVLAA
jgi:glucokinase